MKNPPDAHAPPRPADQRPRLLRLHPDDNVAVAVAALPAGEQQHSGDGSTVTPATAIPAGHKVALAPIDPGNPIVKYGSPIGRASRAIDPGSHVHSHNLADHHTLNTEIEATEPPPPPAPRQASFAGYRRPDGRVGTRNYLLIVSTVNCSASVSKMVAARFDAKRLKRWPHVDGVVAITHDAGCAMAYDGLKHQMLSRTLVGMVRHPNVGACLMIGLGCEQNTVGYMTQEHALVPLLGPDGTRLDAAEASESAATPVLMMQDEGGTRQTIDHAEQIVEKLLDRANLCRRETADASHLCVALECGGSDGYSGITANPAVGAAADRIVACGGAAVLSETSEIYGAEHLLVRRAASVAVAQRLIERILWWKGYAAMFGQELDNNPSAGNKAGGLTTITEKSLGAVSKSGQTALQAVYHYAESITSKGLSVMDTPGFDPSSVTGKVAGGANLVLFTTGRGSCFGFKPTPSIKIASNSALFERLPEDMDLNAGAILAGRSVEEMGEEIFQFALDVASGRPTKSELLGIGDHEFIPWAVGPVL